MHLPDDHMRYAIIWFSLAGLLLIAFAVWLRGPLITDVAPFFPTETQP
jgi:cytochrome oxidase assembly protein ShyY1